MFTIGGSTGIILGNAAVDLRFKDIKDEEFLRVTASVWFIQFWS